MAVATELDWQVVAQKLPLLAALPIAARAGIRVEKLDAGQSLFRAGATPAAMFFVLSGEMRLVRLSRSGSEIVVQRAREGILAEASLDQPAYHCDALASMPTMVLRVPREMIREALKEERFAAAWRMELSRELRRLRAQCERLSLNTAQERIIHYLETEGEKGIITLAQSKKRWAGELGLTHEALYRSLAQMEKSGLIRIEGSNLRLAKRR
jgi:CRP-like cAMP-binding protein